MEKTPQLCPSSELATTTLLLVSMFFTSKKRSAQEQSFGVILVICKENKNGGAVEGSFSSCSHVDMPQDREGFGHFLHPPGGRAPQRPPGSAWRPVICPLTGSQEAVT